MRAEFPDNGVDKVVNLIKAKHNMVFIGETAVALLTVTETCDDHGL